MYDIEEIDEKKLNLNEYYNFNDKIIFNTLDWINFIKEDSNAKPLFLRITQDGRFIGYFTALIVKKFGFKIVGSPFSGWSTCYMGFDIVDNSNRLDLLKIVEEYLFKNKKVSLIEVIDEHISVKEARDRGYQVSVSDTLILDVTPSEEGLYKSFKGDVRTNNRQFEKKGAKLIIAEANDEFAEIYYEQLKDVFAKQNLVPTYSVEKVKCLLRNLKDKENVLCLKALDDEGKCIATSIFLGYNKTFYFWGGASYRNGQKFRPNETMIWAAIKYWKKKGMTKFDMVGVRDYKRKFRSVESSCAQILIAKNKFVINLRNLAKNIYFSMIKVKGKILKRK